MHKKLVLSIIAVFFCILTVSAQEVFNSDETKVGKYVLPSLMVAPNGKTANSIASWEYRRKQILKLFQTNVYGKYPSKPRHLHFEIIKLNQQALLGKAISKQIRIYFTKDKAGPYMDMVLYLPKISKPAPVFIGLNFKGNQSISSADTSIVLSEKHPELLRIRKASSTRPIRGEQAERWPIDTLIKNGYGVATAYYGDLELDFPDGWRTGIRTSLQKELGVKPNEWGAIGAWAWGLSRIMDYLENDKQVDARKVIVTGHSRLGKAALWAGANDTRFAAVISNDSGEGGAALSRRWFGETINKINTAFPHWFVAKYKTYNNNVNALPVDQHMLLALIAPRPLYVASASEDLWADPKGEFLSLKNAEPAYALFGEKGLKTAIMPPNDTSIGESIRYHIRTGPHNILLFDWLQYIKFAKDNL